MGVRRARCGDNRDGVVAYVGGNIASHLTKAAKTGVDSHHYAADRCAASEPVEHSKSILNCFCGKGRGAQKRELFTMGERDAREYNLRFWRGLRRQ